MKKSLLFLTLFVLLCGCGKKIDAVDITSENSSFDLNIEDSELKKTESLPLDYASQFYVDFYEDGYIHIHVEDGSDYVVVPENEDENDLGLSSPVYIHLPCDRIYLAASSAMDLFLELDELGSIAACSTKSSDYAMQEVREAIDSEKITYVGKYSAPDYELLLNLDCNLTIESTMISHSPKIKEQIERINIPVFVERSSYEESPMGRLEWIKLYGLLTGKEAEANTFFEKEVEKIKKIEGTSNNMPIAGDSKINSDKTTVAFFSITSSGYVTVRKPGDYICKMIEMAGGEYVLNNLLVEEDNALSTINIGMEDFYREASDADILIYNGSIDGGVKSLDDFLQKNALLKEFKAVKEGNVWSTSLNMFQESSKIAQIIFEMSALIQDEEEDFVYLKKLQ